VLVAKPDNILGPFGHLPVRARMMTLKSQPPRQRFLKVGLVFLSAGLTSCPGGEAIPRLGHEIANLGRSPLRSMVTSIALADMAPVRESVTPNAPRIATELGSNGDPAAVAPVELTREEEESPADVERVLVSIGRETWIYGEPKAGSRRLGYLRFGAVVGRAAQPASHDDCAQGWYRVSPEGYACNNGRTATLDLEHRLVAFGRQRPDRLAGLPYVYGVPRGGVPPLYARVPTPDEQQNIESTAANARVGREWQEFSLLPMPNWLRQTSNVFGYPRERGALLAGSTVARSAFSLLGLFEDSGRAFGLTTDLTLVPLTRMRPIEPSRFHGLALDERQGLPVVFVLSPRASVFTGEPGTKDFKFARQLSFRDAVSITSRKVMAVGSHWVELTTGEWLRDERLRVVEPPANWPSWAVAGRTWVDVSIGSQTLVAYDGTKPVYVTLVSTGAAGLEDPQKTTATKRGTFQIHMKHVTATMAGNEPGHEFDLHDVPWVQYFTEGYALHAAYWHDDFGHPRSHGCVNLSPLDARWLFHFTSPPVPQSWHGVVANQVATIVNVHP
jgi:hypothetical protein